jgi:hypothetical protein
LIETVTPSDREREKKKKSHFYYHYYLFIYLFILYNEIVGRLKKSAQISFHKKKKKKKKKKKSSMNQCMLSKNVNIRYFRHRKYKYFIECHEVTGNMSGEG